MKSKISLVEHDSRDKRNRKRVRLFTEIPTSIKVLGDAVSAKVWDVSYGGIGLAIAPDSPISFIDSLEAEVAFPDQYFKGRVSNRFILPDNQIKIGLKLRLDDQKDVDFNKIDSSWDQISDKETVLNIYSDLVYKGFEAPIEIKQGFSRLIVYPQKKTTSETIICEIGKVVRGKVSLGSAKCIFDIFQTCHAFDTIIERIDSDKVEIKMSPFLARLLRRQTVRVQKNETSNAKVRLYSQGLNTSIDGYEIFDFSEYGLSLIDRDQEMSLPRGLFFDQIEVNLGDGQKVLGRGQVRSYGWSREKNSYILGLFFEVTDKVYLDNWHDFILKARYPGLDFGYKDEDHEKVWNLFEKSGYLGLKPKESFDLVYDITKKTWKNLDDAGSEISKRIKIVSEDGILGHIQLDKIYPKTWCIHHLSIDPGASKLVGKEIYSVTTDVILSEGGEFIFSLTEAEKPWNQRAYYDFISGYRFPEHNFAKKLQVYEVDLQKPVEDRPKNLNIRVANKWDLRKVLRFFESNSSLLEREAYGLNSEDLTLDNLKREYSQYGLDRERNFLVAVDGNDNLLGFSRIEMGSTGVNIFGLLDLLFVYSSVGSPKERGLIFDELINESLRYFQNRGKKDVILVLDDNRVEHYKEIGYHYIWDGILWLARKDILPRYHAHTQLLYGQLILQRDKIRSKRKHAKSK